MDNQQQLHTKQLQTINKLAQKAHRKQPTSKALTQTAIRSRPIAFGISLGLKPVFMPFGGEAKRNLTLIALRVSPVYSSSCFACSALASGLGAESSAAFARVIEATRSKKVEIPTADRKHEAGASVSRRRTMTPEKYVAKTP